MELPFCFFAAEAAAVLCWIKASLDGIEVARITDVKNIKINVSENNLIANFTSFLDHCTSLSLPQSEKR